ncbi:hypothetical protein [Calidithermus timidus]|jgi:hypothetical protein|nr:hypothetical protein [Calidithermus timidus]
MVWLFLAVLAVVAVAAAMVRRSVEQMQAIHRDVLSPYQTMVVVVTDDEA